MSNTKSTSILKAAWLIAMVTIISKIVGFLRDVVIANYYGASLVSDAYFYAYQIPAFAMLLLGGVNGPFHSAAVSVFTKIIPNFKEKAPENASKLYSTFITASFIFCFVLASLIFIFANQIMAIIISGNNAELISLAALHLKIMSPVIIIGGLVGIYYGLLVVYGEFLLPNLSPIILSAVIITTLIFTNGDSTGKVLALASTVGAVCQFLLQLPKIKQIGFKFRPNFDFVNNPNFKSVLELLFPAILSSTIGQIHIYVDMFFASSLKEGAWTAIGFANRIFQFPVGILTVAFLVPLFPIFSKLVVQKDFEGVRNYFSKGVGTLLFIAIPIIICILILAQDAVALIFQRGAFNENATLMVAEALWFLSISIIPYVFRDSITRVFYAFNDSRTPFIVAFSSVALKAILNMLLVERFGIGGITLSTSFVTLFNAVLLGILIRKKISLNYRTLAKNFGKMCIAGITAFGICYYISAIMNSLSLSLQMLALAKICIIGLVCIIIYVGLNLLLKVDYVIELANRLKEKIKCL